MFKAKNGGPKRRAPDENGEGPFASLAGKGRGEKGPFSGMVFLLFSALALAAGTVSYFKGQATFAKGLDASSAMLWEVLPRMVAAFLVAGFFQVLLPKDFIMKWIGERSGFRGICIATLAGVLTPGGPLISFPLIAALYKLGADYGALVAFLTSWELMGFMRTFVWEIPMLGLKFVLLRFLVSLAFPLMAGLIARRLVLVLDPQIQLKEG